MRSDLIFGALTHVNNRYELCQLASKATRKLHKPNTRLQDTTNEVLDRFKDTIPMDESRSCRREGTIAGTPRSLTRGSFTHRVVSTITRFTTHPQYRFHSTSGLPHDPLVKQIPPQFQTIPPKIQISR